MTLRQLQGLPILGEHCVSALSNGVQDYLIRGRKAVRSLQISAFHERMSSADRNYCTSPRILQPVRKHMGNLSLLGFVFQR